MGMSHDFEVADRGRRHARARRDRDFRRPHLSLTALSPKPLRPISLTGRKITHECQPARPSPAAFSQGFRGFDPVEVASFLAAVADDYEQALRETDRLRQDLMRMEAVLSEHREHEKNLQSTLMTAQKLSDDIKANAELEAQAHHPRSRRALRSAARENAGAARGHPARDRRPQAEAQGRRNLDRSQHHDAPEHARVRPRAGSARARRQDPAAPAAAARRADRHRRARTRPARRRVITARRPRHPAGPQDRMRRVQG